MELITEQDRVAVIGSALRPAGRGCEAGRRGRVTLLDCGGNPGFAAATITAVEV
jgi:hypothetical protein